MNLNEFIEFTKERKKQLSKKSTANTPVVQYDEENDPSNFIIDKLPKNHVSKTPVDRDLEDVMTVESEPEKSKALLNSYSQYYNIEDNIIDEISSSIAQTTPEKKYIDKNSIIESALSSLKNLSPAYAIYDKLTDNNFENLKNIGRGAGQNLATYSAAFNSGISTGLDALNPYTWITGKKTDLSQWFDDAANTNRELYDKWQKDSEGSKLATASKFILDPALLAPTGLAASGSKLARMAQSGLAGAGIGAGVSFLKDYGAGGTGFENIGLGAGAGGAVNALIAGLTRGKAPNISGMADNYINEPYSLKKELSAIADEVSDLYKQNIRPLTKSGRQANLKDEFREYVSSGNLNKSIDEIDSSLVSQAQNDMVGKIQAQNDMVGKIQAQNDMVGKIQAQNDSANGTFLNRYIPGTDYYRNLENYKNNIDNIKLEKSLQDAAGRQSEQMYNAGLNYNKNYNDYLKKINPATDDIISRYDEMYNNNSILDTSKSNHYKILEDTANKYIEDISDIPLSSKYKVLNNNNYDTVMNDFKKPEFRVLNNKNIDDILSQDDELMASISNIRRKNKNMAKNKSIDEIISEYEYKDTSYLQKEFKKVLKNLEKSDIYKQAQSIKQNKNNMAVNEYDAAIQELQQKILLTDDGRKLKALKNIIKNRENAPSPANYKANKKPLTNAVNITDMQPKSITSLKSADDTYNYTLPKIEDDVLDTSPKNQAQYDNVLNSSHSLRMTKSGAGTQGIIPDFSGKNIEIIDSTTGEVLNIPVELLDIIKKKALMNY